MRLSWIENLLCLIKPRAYRFVSICGPILEPVTPVTAPINIGPSSPLRARKISSCYDLKNHKTLANIELLRLLRLRLLPLNSGSGGKSFSLSAAPGPLGTISALISPCASVQFRVNWWRFVVKLSFWPCSGLVALCSGQCSGSDLNKTQCLCRS